MNPETIVIRGAKEHNLKKIDITLPRHKLIVLTGVSGSGKSSLAFDTLFMRRDSGAMWNPSRPLPGSSSDRWRSPKWILSAG